MFDPNENSNAGGCKYLRYIVEINFTLQRHRARHRCENTMNERCLK